MKNMEMTIIGVGNSGCAYAFKLSQNGHKMRLFIILFDCFIYGN